MERSGSFVQVQSVFERAYKFSSVFVFEIACFSLWKAFSSDHHGIFANLIFIFVVIDTCSYKNGISMNVSKSTYTLDVCVLYMYMYNYVHATILCGSTLIAMTSMFSPFSSRCVSDFSFGFELTEAISFIFNCSTYIHLTFPKAYCNNST